MLKGVPIRSPSSPRMPRTGLQSYRVSVCAHSQFSMVAPDRKDQYLFATENSQQDPANFDSLRQSPEPGELLHLACAHVDHRLALGHYGLAYPEDRSQAGKPDGVWSPGVERSIK